MLIENIVPGKYSLSLSVVDLRCGALSKTKQYKQVIIQRVINIIIEVNFYKMSYIHISFLNELITSILMNFVYNFQLNCNIILHI